MQKRIIGIVHNVPVPEGHEFYESSLDVMTQVESIEKSLLEMGHKVVRIPFTTNINEFISKVKKEKVEVVFNLCETIDEDPRYIAHPAALLELLKIPFSGAPSSGLMLTTDKLMTKQLLKTNGIRTPNYQMFDGLRYFRNGLKYPVIIKPRFEDASIGIDQESILKDGKEMKSKISDFFYRFGSLVLEEYIDGREFNVAIFGYPEPKVINIAEIKFDTFPDDLYKIVGYKAKWDQSSFEYHNTPRAFPKDLSPEIVNKIQYIAMECCRIFNLRDYARVDIRMDSLGNINVLEINANPCLSPDAGFPAALDNVGMNYNEMVQNLLEFMLLRLDHEKVVLPQRIQENK